MRIISGRRKSPLKMLIHGEPGVGKSTFAAGAPKCLFLDFEGRLSHLDVARNDTPPRAYADVFGSKGLFASVLSGIEDGSIECENVCIDTADALSDLIEVEAVQSYNSTKTEGPEVSTLEEIGWGKGKRLRVPGWRRVIRFTDLLRERGIGVIFTAHSMPVKTNDPLMAEFFRHEPALPGTIGEMLMAWADDVFYAFIKRVQKTEDLGFNKTRTRATSNGARRMYCEDAGGAAAKNSCDLPREMELDFDAYWALREAFYNNETTETTDE